MRAPMSSAGAAQDDPVHREGTHMNHITAHAAAWRTRPTQAEKAGLALRFAVRSTCSRWGAMAVAGVGLLGAFQYVVGESVARGQALSRDMATQADAMWRCNDLREAQGRAACRGRLRVAKADSLLSTSP
jgi:hypothetical protein